MAYTTINKSTAHFNTKLYTGNASTNALTGVGFQPDLVWLKSRSFAQNHEMYDAVRTATKRIYPNGTYVEDTDTAGLTAFNSDGFTLGSSNSSNKSGDTFASWNWKAGTGQGSSNTDGSINTTYTSVNTTAGFSISKYTGTGSNATVGHGLGAVPKMIIVKRLSGGTGEWGVYNANLGNTKALYLNGTSASSTETAFWNSTSPTSSVFSVGTANDTNGSGSTYIAYCFADVQGYSKVSGSYTGNGNVDGTFVYTGFKPKYILWKLTNSAGTGFQLVDATINPHNVSDAFNFPYSTTGEYENSANNMDILSNGFKWRNTDVGRNGNGDSYIYYAVGQSLVGSNNVPCTAR